MRKTVSLLLALTFFAAMLPFAFADSGSIEIRYNDKNISFTTVDVDTIVSRALHFEAYDENGRKLESVNWKSNNETMARVDEKGFVVINLEKEGEVIISCQSTDGSGRISSTKLRLYKRVHNLSLEHYGNFSMRSGSIVSLSPRFLSPVGLEYTPSNAQLNWEVISGGEYAYFSNPSSGTLCSNVVSKPETVRVRLRSADNAKAIAYMDVTINPAVEDVSILRSGVDVSGRIIEASVSVPVKLNARMVPSQGAGIVWSSSSTSAKVMDGLVIASAPCSAIITAAAADGSGISASVTIEFK